MRPDETRNDMVVFMSLEKVRGKEVFSQIIEMKSFYLASPSQYDDMVELTDYES